MRYQHLAEAKARIDHPEDLGFDQSQVTRGITNAIGALKYITEHPNAVTIKIDGSPALIFGRDNEGFTVTDKAGFGKGLEGLPRTSEQLIEMLYLRIPNQPGRQAFAQSMGACWSYLERLLPDNFTGFLQGDLLWIGQPTVVNGMIQFSPNKIVYSIPVASPLGRSAAGSTMAIVLHSYFGSQQQHEPRAINLDQLQLNSVAGLLVLDCRMTVSTPLTWPGELANELASILKTQTGTLDSLFDQGTLRSKQLTDFPMICKKFLANRASRGIKDASDMEREFFEWLQSDFVTISDRKRANLLVYVSGNSAACRVFWDVERLIIAIKQNIYHQLDQQADSIIHAELRGRRQHEGFVAETPYGRIKLVDRPEFMLSTN